MSGYKRPPKHSRFTKGQSGNPSGRPKSNAAIPASAFDLTLKAAERMVRVREGDQVYQISSLEAVVRAQHASALKGSAMAQKHIIETHTRALAAARQELEADNERWNHTVERLRSLYADAASRGDPEPEVLPHPDDVVIDPERGVRFIGPIDQDELAKLRETIRMRDLLILQDALDQRQAETGDDDQPMDRPGSALLFATTLNALVPRRHRLTDAAMVEQMMRAGSMTKRELAKALYQSWRALGGDPTRGTTFPSLGVGAELLEMVYNAVAEAAKQR